MSYFCTPCNRAFKSWDHLRQHEEYSSSHPQNTSRMSYTYDCGLCGAEFLTDEALEKHMSYHSYCASCDRRFDSDHSLRQHLNSKEHRGGISCSGCTIGPFPTISSWVIHTESGTCPNGTEDWRSINEYMRSKDRRNRFTIDTFFGEEDPSEDVVGPHAWNGSRYESGSICLSQFLSLNQLNQHSAGHSTTNYRCPGCPKEYVKLSSLLAHLESEVCGWVTFERMQENRGLDDIVDCLLGY